MDDGRNACLAKASITVLLMPRDVKVLFEHVVFSVKDELEEERMIGNCSFQLLEGWNSRV